MKHIARELDPVVVARNKEEYLEFENQFLRTQNGRLNRQKSSHKKIMQIYGDS